MLNQQQTPDRHSELVSESHRTGRGQILKRVQDDDNERVSGNKKVRVFAFGTFDGVHAGHRAYLREAKSYGDHLTVVVANDANVVRIKGHDPEFDQETRRQLVESTKLADRVLIGSPDQPLDIFNRERIDVVVLGYDQHVSLDEVREAAHRVTQSPLIVRAHSHHQWLLKTRLLKRLGWVGSLFRQTSS